MGSRGPVPNRTDERRRRNNEAGQQDVTRAPGASSVDMPAADPEWHDTAKHWFESLAESGQSRFYEPSDWWTAYYVATAMSKSLQGKMSSVMFAAVMSASAELMATEGSRRRLRLELDKNTGDPDEAASVSALDDYRKTLGVVK